MKYLDFKTYTNKKNGQVIVNPSKKQLTKAKIRLPTKYRVPIMEFRKWIS